MKTARFFTIAALATSLVACNDAAESEAATGAAQEVKEVAEAVTYPVSAQSGHVAWIGFKTNVDWSHNGTIQVKDGEFKVKDGELVGGNFTIDMKTIRPLDLEEGTENYTNLVGHLESPDFFETSAYPTATFEITNVSKVQGGAASHEVQGNLTMKDTTNNITFPANIQVTDGVVSFKTPEFSINRTKWNVMFRSSGIEGVMKDDLIDDYIKLSVDLTAQK
ncbi:MAG: YceI family protein [Bacteroidetes bacterium]|uniref:YceI family protein n=1 Tax=Phaeocystidibacter marisrubri TaxID=1577780 RepID=A0A6L3ZH56_9FLAO|nr:YceI family protein [Phaeocystidibacter marisrubri]KAB2817356.1 YceI family protein [Phaeocystidibacter marisrubri]TNE26952.1 MAG: YceI family protein [Bacteroidota bacterium]GGH75764.1 hypothetical protein GCM10011318_23110 [Phaeocystidibacter marisrubri]